MHFQISINHQNNSQKFCELITTNSLSGYLFAKDKGSFAFALSKIKSFVFLINFERIQINFTMMSYNLMALFKTFLLQEKTQKRFSILKYKTFKISDNFEKFLSKVLKSHYTKNEDRGLMDSGIILKLMILNFTFLMSNLF